MAGIVGILQEGQHNLVASMLDTISHRGNYKKTILDKNGATIGIVWSHHEDNGMKEKLEKEIFMDGPGFGHEVKVSRFNGRWQIYRDELGVAPMYFTSDIDWTLCFASEVKALLQISTDVFEIPSGHEVNEMGTKKYFDLEMKPPLQKDPKAIAMELLNLLSLTVSRRITSDTMGSWLSGGLDSSAIAALARPWIKKFHTFSGGLGCAPDLEYAKEMAKHLGAEHHEILINFQEMLRVLPLVIYHLESFDPLLVRSSIINYLVAEEAAGYVEEVFSGEGGDEFFAGYDYLKKVDPILLDKELVEIAGRLHNTALQRVDRCAAAHGLTAHVVFADPQLFDFTLRIPSNLKLKDGVEKWILRKAFEGTLPERVLWRTKAKFWEGSGVGTLLSDYANIKVSDSDFKTERILNNGWSLNTKEELFYYRIFIEYFGKLENLDWMGRTKDIMPHTEGFSR
ncbi:MAG: asparagine synthase-related protein [Bacteroidales bacterium]|nr:asparagine synthase-related protein [Bacteroidales bacterium]